MKTLDTFSRVEQSVYQISAAFTIWGAPILVIWLADSFILKDLDPFFRYPLWVVCALVGFPIGFMLSSPILYVFESLRKLLGLRPLSELEKEIENQQWEQESSIEESSKRRFSSLPENERLYELRQFAQFQLKQLARINSQLEIIKIVIIGIFILLVVALYIKP